MSALAYAAPLALLLTALSFFYVADYHRKRKAGRFDLVYSFGHLLILAAVYLVYSTLQFAGNGIANALFGFFQLVLWVYVIITMFMVLRLLTNMINLLKDVVRNKRGLNEWVKIYF